MRNLLALLGVLAVFLAGEARASAVAFQGTLSVSIAGLPPISISGSGTANVSGGSGSGTGTGFTLPGGTFATVLSVPVTAPTAFPIAGVKASLSNGAGSFDTPGGGVMGLSGSTDICLFSACDTATQFLSIPFTVGGTRGVGIGGAPIVVTGLLNLTLQGAPWTTGRATIMTPGGTLAATGFVGPDSVRLVTPIVVNTGIGASPILPAFGTLTLQFVPEPGTLLLTAAGLVALGLMRRPS